MPVPNFILEFSFLCLTSEREYEYDLADRIITGFYLGLLPKEKIDEKIKILSLSLHFILNDPFGFERRH
jgi:hypothetical protein